MQTSLSYANPELYVVWTSQDKPVADYDIRSIDTNGHSQFFVVRIVCSVWWGEAEVSAFAISRAVSQ